MPPLFKKNKYSTVHKPERRGVPAGLWLKCKGCETIVYKSKLGENFNMCPNCQYHYPLTADQRIDLLSDKGSFVEHDAGLSSGDPLEFVSTKGAYKDKKQADQAKTGMNDAVKCGHATLDGKPLALGVMDFRFIGGSMGSVVGEKITLLTEYATAEKIPLVVVCASGGARMQEGMYSLMQMAKTSAAVAKLQDAGLPYIAILTHPTTGGVTASFASLGDVILAEPKALIGFAGARVIKQTTKAELPDGFQQAEFLQEKGFIDRIVPRQELRGELSLLLEYFSAASDTKK